MDSEEFEEGDHSYISQPNEQSLIEAEKEYADLIQNLRTVQREQAAASLTRGSGILAKIAEVGMHETHLEADIILISNRRKGERS